MWVGAFDWSDAVFAVFVVVGDVVPQGVRGRDGFAFGFKVPHPRASTQARVLTRFVERFDRLEIVDSNARTAVFVFAQNFIGVFDDIIGFGFFARFCIRFGIFCRLAIFCRGIGLFCRFGFIFRGFILRGFRSFARFFVGFDEHGNDFSGFCRRFIELWFSFCGFARFFVGFDESRDDIRGFGISIVELSDDISGFSVDIVSNFSDDISGFSVGIVCNFSVGIVELSDEACGFGIGVVGLIGGIVV